MCVTFRYNFCSRHFCPRNKYEYLGNYFRYLSLKNLNPQVGGMWLSEKSRKFDVDRNIHVSCVYVETGSFVLFNPRTSLHLLQT